MKAICLALWLITLESVCGVQVLIDNGNITFDAPDNFTPLTKEEVAKKFPMQTGPLNALGTATRAVSITYSLTDNPLRPEQLPEAKDAIAEFMTKTGHAQWIKNDFIEVNGTRWVYMEALTPAQDGIIHIIGLTTSYRNVMLVIGFNATSALFPQYESQLRASLSSIKTKSKASVLDSLPSSNEMLSPEEYVRRGGVQMDIGYLTGAQEDFDAALLINPNFAKAQIGLGKIDADRASFADAIRHYSVAISDDPQLSEGYSRRAWAEVETGQIEPATFDVSRAIALAPTSAFAYRVKAYIDERSGDLKLAMSDYNKALTFKTDYSPALIGRARLEMTEGFLRDARHDLETVNTLPHHASITYELALLSILEDRPDAALSELKGDPMLAVHGAPTDDGRLLMWELESEAGYRDQADEDLSAFLKDDTQYKKKVTKVVGGYLTDLVSESDLLLSASSTNPLNQEVQLCRLYYFIGVKAKLAGNQAKMNEAFQKCVATNQRHLGYYLLAEAAMAKTAK